MVNEPIENYGPIIFLNPAIDVIGPALGGFQMSINVQRQRILLPAWPYESIDAVVHHGKRVWVNENTGKANLPELDEFLPYEGVGVIFNPSVRYQQGKNSEGDPLHILVQDPKKVAYSHGEFEAVFSRGKRQLYELESRII